MYRIELKCRRCGETFWDETEDGPGIFIFQVLDHFCNDENREIIGICDVIAYRKDE